MDRDRRNARLSEAFGEVSEASGKKAKKDPYLTGQRNIPRELVNAITDRPELRYTVWQLTSLPKGTQAARLIRFMEDKGWRSFEAGGRRFFYHGRSFKLLDLPHAPKLTVYGVYSLMRPKGPDDDHPNRLDMNLVKLWGVKRVGETTDYRLRKSPSKKFIESLTGEQGAELAEDLSDQLYQHTGIVFEPVTAKLPLGEPADRADDVRSDLPPGVDPGDTLVIAEGGRFYAVPAGKFSPGIVHDSTAVVDSGKTSIGMPNDPFSIAGVTDDDDGTSPWSDIEKKYARPLEKGGSAWAPTPGKEAQAMKRALGLKEAPESRVQVTGDGALYRIVSSVIDSGRKYVYLVPAGKKQEIDTFLQANQRRGEGFSEADHVARMVKETGGLPVSPGKWDAVELRKYIRMFERDYGTRL